MSRPSIPHLLYAALLIVASGTAQALTPDDGTPDVFLYLPGSQANDAFFQPAVCLSGTAHVYFQNNTPADPAKATNNDYWAVYCKTDGSKVSGLTGEKKVWISRRRLGASYVGLDALVNGTKLTYLADPSAANCKPFSGTFTSAGVGFKYDYSCATVTDGIAATASISDVTPDVFHGPDNVPSGKADIEVSKIDNRYAIAGHIIGTPVTLKLRNALQYAQVLNGALPSTCVAPGTAVDAALIETADCMPSLTKQQLASLFSGKVSDWNTFNVNVNGTPKTLGEVAADWVAKGGDSNYLNVPRDTTVHVCRRENGAGQQVALLANILQNPCLGTAMTRLIQPGGQADAQFATSLGAVDNCLKDFNDGTSSFLSASGPAHGNQWAISIQTTERNVNRATNYRFIKIDGAAPTLHQVALGKYPLWSEYGIQWLNSVSADQAKLLNAMVAYGQSPVNVNARNATAVHSFGPAGYVALSSNGYAPDRVFNPANPVNPYTRVNNGVPDACAIPVVNPDYATAELPGATASATPAQTACALPWGGTLAHGKSVIAYGAASAADCSAGAEIRTCNNGTLSGSATNQSCVAPTAQNCALPWGGTLTSGQSVLAYSAASSNNCAAVEETRFCVNGTLTGNFINPACSGPSITVQAPNGGESIKAGNKQTIRWSSSSIAASEKVNIAFSTDGGATWKALKNGVKVGASYLWKPTKGQATTDGKIQVCLANPKSGEVCDSSDASFSVVK